jgi:hypothetical protein
VIITLDFLVEAVGIGTNITFIIVSPYIDEVATLCISRGLKGSYCSNFVKVLGRKTNGLPLLVEGKE